MRVRIPSIVLFYMAYPLYSSFYMAYLLYSSFLHGQHGLSFITQVGTSALTQAAGDGHADIVVELVKAGANLDLQRNV